MKPIRKYILAVLTLSTLLFAGCEKDFDEINTNPNKVEKPIAYALFTQSTRELAFNNFDVWYLLRQSALCSQQWCQNNYTDEDRYTFRTGVLNTFFRENYATLNNFQKIIELNTDAGTKDEYASLYGDNNMQIAISEIMKCWTLHLLVDQFGDIPYSEALDINITQPKYDTQKEVYDGLIATLKDCKNKLAASTTGGYSTGDVIYDGDLSKWIKFANSLRLRLALRASAVDASYLTEAQAAIADGVFSSVGDDAKCPFFGVGVPDEAPLYNGYVTEARNDFTFTHRFIELLKGNNDGTFINPFNGIVDPRFYVYTGSTTTNKFGIPYGLNDDVNKQYWSDLSTAGTAINLPTANAKVVQSNYPTTFLDYATVCFMVSEVNNWDASWFEKGINASLDHWGATNDGVYTAAIMALFNAATTEGKKEMVLTQKYIHLLTQSHEAWAEYRRTGYPKTIIEPGQLTATINGTSYYFTPDGGETEICTRFCYVTSEFTLNSTNVNAAITRMGGDTYNTKLWWDVN